MNKYGFVGLLLAGILLISVLGTNIYVSYEEEKTTIEEEDVLVVTSFYPMYIATENVIGDMEGVHLENLSEPQTGCLHDYQLTTADMQLLAKADVLVINGGGAESFLEDVLKAYPELPIINASELLEEDIHEEYGETEEHTETEEHVEDEMQEEHSHDGHEHSELAHIWMCPGDYEEQVQHIADELSKLLPEMEEQFQSNVSVYRQQIDGIEIQIEQLRSQITDGNVVILHEAFKPLCEEAGLHVVSEMNLDEERQISSGEVADMVTAIKEHPGTIVLAEETYGQEMAQALKRETNATVVFLDTLTRGNLSRDSYIEEMTNNILLLKEALLP